MSSCRNCENRRNSRRNAPVKRTIIDGSGVSILQFTLNSLKKILFSKWPVSSIPKNRIKLVPKSWLQIFELTFSRHSRPLALWSSLTSMTTAFGWLTKHHIFTVHISPDRNRACATPAWYFWKPSVLNVVNESCDERVKTNNKRQSIASVQRPSQRTT